LWPNGAPGFESRRNEPQVAKDYWVANIHNPSITLYLPSKEKAMGAAVVICPGGGHRLLVFNAEGDEPARYLASIGVAAFVLKYRLGRQLVLIAGPVFAHRARPISSAVNLTTAFETWSA